MFYLLLMGYGCCFSSVWTIRRLHTVTFFPDLLGQMNIWIVSYATCTRLVYDCSNPEIQSILAHLPWLSWGSSARQDNATEQKVKQRNCNLLDGLYFKAPCPPPTNSGGCDICKCQRGKLETEQVSSSQNCLCTTWEISLFSLTGLFFYKRALRLNQVCHLDVVFTCRGHVELV